MDALITFKENSEMETIIAMYLTSSIVLAIFIENEEDAVF